MGGSLLVLHLVLVCRPPFETIPSGGRRAVLPSIHKNASTMLKGRPAVEELSNNGWNGFDGGAQPCIHGIAVSSDDGRAGGGVR
jgi:hypothetical protein